MSNKSWLARPRQSRDDSDLAFPHVDIHVLKSRRVPVLLKKVRLTTAGKHMFESGLRIYPENLVEVADQKLDVVGLRTAPASVSGLH